MKILVEAQREQGDLEWLKPKPFMATYDFLDQLNHHFNKSTMLCDLNAALHRAAAKCLNCELSQSNTLMKAQLTYRHNVARKTSAVVFV